VSSRVLPVGLAVLALTCDDTGVAPDDMTSACRREAECSGVPHEGALSERECTGRLSAEYDDATSYGCGAAYADWVSCLATTRGECQPPVIVEESLGDDSGDAEASSAYVDPCNTAWDALQACQGRARRDTCAVIGFGGAGGCGIRCALFFGECSPPTQSGTSSTCTCAECDRTGATFSGQCSSAELETSARDACQ